MNQERAMEQIAYLDKWLRLAILDNPELFPPQEPISIDVYLRPHTPVERMDPIKFEVTGMSEESLEAMDLDEEQSKRLIESLNYPSEPNDALKRMMGHRRRKKDLEFGLHYGSRRHRSDRPDSGPSYRYIDETRVWTTEDYDKLMDRVAAEYAERGRRIGELVFQVDMERWSEIVQEVDSGPFFEAAKERGWEEACLEFPKEGIYVLKALEAEVA